MCGRFTLAKDASAVKGAFPDLPVDPKLRPRYNIAPTQPVAAWLADPSPRMEIFSWGLVPSWAKDPGFGAKCINARAETLEEKASFRTAFRRKRCVIPADGWYEWRRGEGGVKLPVRFRRRDEAVFGFAGLWEEWHDREGGMILSCAVITTRANALVRRVHPRMPAVLREEDAAAWLDAETAVPDLRRMLEPVAGDDFTVDAVSPVVNRAGIEGAHLIEPWSPPAVMKQADFFDIV